MNLENLREVLSPKNILILGFAREGRDSLIFLRKVFPEKIIGIGDRSEFKKLDKESRQLINSDKRIKLHLGKNYLKNIEEYDVILKTPGIPFHLKELERAKKKGVIITSQAGIFLEHCPGTIIGITGTKGKSTTTSLIHNILKKAAASKRRASRLVSESERAPKGRGLKTHLVGNIGKPVLSLLFKAGKKDIYVYELSSHQLFDVKQSPKIAVFLNVFPEHLDYYRNFKEYALAKGNITKFQNEKDYLVFNSKNKTVREIAKKSKARKIDLNSLKLEKIIKVKDVPLKGEFNLQNVKAASAVGKILGLNDKIIAEGIKKFKPLPYRLEFIGQYKGIKFYNDALATIPEATIAALDALGNDVQTIMLGGFERNIDFSKLAERIFKSEIKTVILFPTTGVKIWQAIRKEFKKKKNKNLPFGFPVDNMEKAVKISYQKTKKNKACLLSTASSSFSMFKDYKEKGDLFKKYVKKYGEKS